MAVYELKYDAYRVGDRLLDGVSFRISLEIEGFSATVGSVAPWDEGDASYLQNLNFEHFSGLAVGDLEAVIADFAVQLAEDGVSFETAMAEFEEDTGEPGVQVLMEV